MLLYFIISIILILDELKDKRKKRILAMSNNKNLVNMNKVAAKDYNERKYLINQQVIFL